MADCRQPEDDEDHEVIEVRQDLLKEEDGPMLLHGLQGMHLKPLFVPRASASKPDPDRLKVRWERFRAAG